MRGAASSSSNPSHVQGICPNSWHVPSDDEWDQLVNYVSSQSQYWCGGNSTYIGKSLSSTYGWTSASGTCSIGYSQSSNNTSGFAAPPAGDYNGSYTRFGNIAVFWSATESSSSTAYVHYLWYNGIYGFDRGQGDSKQVGFSVRCVKD